MLEPNKPGRPLVPLSETERLNLLEWIGHDLLLANCARHIGITHLRLMRLLKRGEQDIENDINSQFAQLHREVSKKQAEKISKLLNQIQQCPKNWQALAWTLEKCMREEFGAEAPIIKELVERWEKIEQSLKASDNNPLNGINVNG